MKTKRLLSLFLILVLLSGIVPFAPQTAHAAGTLNNGDYIYFGNYGGTPILWKVTGVSGGKADLLSEYILYDHIYNNHYLVSDTPVLTFLTSKLYEDLNGGDFKTDSSVFTSAEQGAIAGDVTIPANNIGVSFKRDGSADSYWLSKDPTQYEWSGDFCWNASYTDNSGNEVATNVNNPSGVRPVLQIDLSAGAFGSGFAVPAITAVTNGDTVGHRTGEARTSDLEIKVSGKNAFAGNVVRVKLTSGANTISADYTLQAADLTSGVFTDKSVEIPAASFTGKPEGSYAVKATLINKAGSHEVPLSTGSAVNNYPIKAAASTDASLISVAGQAVSAAGTGTSASPKTASVSVDNNKASIALSDIAVATGAGKHIYSDNGFTANEDKAINLSVGTNHVYVKVTAENGTTVLYYDVTVTRAAVPTYALTVAGGTGSGAYAAGTQVSIQADAAVFGKTFDKWITSGGGTFANAASANTTFTMPGNAVTVTATYKDVVITGLPATYTMYTGGRVIWEPQPDGGTWSWDHDFFSATFNSPATFKALKAGKSVITYTVGGVSQSVSVTVKKAELPLTGQDFTWTWILGALAVLCGVAAVFLMRLKRRQAR